MTKQAVIPALAGTPVRDNALDRLLHPDRFFAGPADVVQATHLNVAEKRAILASWASDACAVESCPTLRHPRYVADPVSFDDVMDALEQLDRLPSLAHCDGYGDGVKAANQENLPV
ncbi:hypothetical protein [Bosea sp. BK604]|uniref:hypothetical protein n=1 Tax=Bosea sp. BK604 TaxID=2512180 RepID=UPI001045B169|nr:hypothetical protein [Bosea sp. BK604]